MNYDPETAFRMSRLCKIAYNSGRIAEEEAITYVGAEAARAVDCGSVEFLAAKFGPDVSVAFRGSSEGDDFLRDVWASLKFRDGLPGRVHSGLSLGPLEASQSLTDVLGSFLGPDGFLDIAGHSKGGAEALFAAWLLKASGLPVRSVHVFGCPAVGDREFAQEYTAAIPETWTHVFGADLVARAPILCRALGIYWPVGRLVFHTEDDTFLRVGWWKYLVESVKAITRRRGRVDHFTANYVAATRRGIV